MLVERKIKIKNIYILLVISLFITVVTYGNETLENNSETKNNTLNLENIKNDDYNLYIEFTNEEEYKNKENLDKNTLEVYEKYDEEKKENVREILEKEDNYDILINNMNELDEDYIISSRIFNMTDIEDEYEPFSRRMYAFNTQLDSKFLYPVSQVYKKIVPKPIREGISNFNDNFSEIPSFISSVIQLKPKKALISLGRFIINSTVGILGINDVASKVGLKKDRESLADAVGHYGVKSGSFLVLPLFGPTVERDVLPNLVEAIVTTVSSGYVKNNVLLETGVLREASYNTLNVLTVLNERSFIDFKYGDLNSPFEYDLVKIIMYNLKRINESKLN